MSEQNSVSPAFGGEGAVGQVSLTRGASGPNIVIGGVNGGRPVGSIDLHRARRDRRSVLYDPRVEGPLVKVVFTKDGPRIVVNTDAVWMRTCMGWAPNRMSSASTPRAPNSARKVCATSAGRPSSLIARVANHTTAGDGIIHDADADHVPYATED